MVLKSGLLGGIFLPHVILDGPEANVASGGILVFVIPGTHLQEIRHVFPGTAPDHFPRIVLAVGIRVHG